MNEITRRQEARVRRAEQMLTEVASDALAKTAALLELIADGTLSPATAATAARDLRRLLAAFDTASGIRRRRVRPSANRPTIH